MPVEESRKVFIACDEGKQLSIFDNPLSTLRMFQVLVYTAALANAHTFS